MARDDSVVDNFIDFRTAGPGTLPQIFAKSDAIVSTEDSSSMISEAVSARLPVIGVSPRAARFTELIGDPPMRYLGRWRMQLAARRLSDSRDPVAQIAFDAGYESEAAFSRAFKRSFGTPPATWRKENARPETARD